MFLKYLLHTKLLALFTIMLVLICIGTGTFMVFEGWSFIDALYFTVATIMTVGYGNFAPTFVITKIVAIGFMILFIPMLLVSVGIVADAVFAAGNAKHSKRRKR